MKRELNIFGEKYNIELVKDPARMEEISEDWMVGECDECECSDGLITFGLCLSETNEIKVLTNLLNSKGITKELPMKTQMKTLFHEVVHAYLEVINPEISANEDLVGIFTTVLYHMWIDGNFSEGIFDLLMEEDT